MARKNCYFDKTNTNLVCVDGVGIQDSRRGGVFDVKFPTAGSPSVNTYTILRVLGKESEGFRAIAVHICVQFDKNTTQEFLYLIEEKYFE